MASKDVAIEMERTISKIKAFLLVPDGPMDFKASAMVALRLLKILFSAFLFFLCLVVAMMLADNAGKVIALWILTFYLGTLEGGQVAIVRWSSIED